MPNILIVDDEAGIRDSLAVRSLTMLRFDAVPGLPGVVYLETPDGGLLLDSRDGLRKGGDSGYPSADQRNTVGLSSAQRIASQQGDGRPD